jgi:hypothetical protein
MSAFADLAGKRFGRLVAQWPVGRSGKSIYWLCVCDCGNLKVVRGHHLTTTTRLAIRSCRCLSAEQSRNHPPQLRHGHTWAGGGTPTYKTWSSMVRRCSNPKAGGWERYGGRGIKVCERWLKFDNFLADMGKRPPNLTLDRKNNDGNYEPGNCRWATRSEQQHNRRPMPARTQPRPCAHCGVITLKTSLGMCKPCYDRARRTPAH